MAARTSHTQTGNAIFDRSYEIISAVGRGRNSVVYKARKLSPRNAREEIVALKVLLGNPKQRGFNHRRMRREALAMLACRHPNVVRLNDYVSTKDLCYLSMEYADGGDLRALLETRSSPLSVEQAIDICVQVLRGLEAIHRSGVIHRDIKPENVLLSGESNVKIADFGVAVLPVQDLNEDDLSLGIGTFDYLAPETLRDGIADVRSDLYSVGVTLYQLATNHLPFEGRSISWQINQKMQSLSLPLDKVLPNAPLHLAELFKKALATNAGERFQTAAEFRNALEQFLAGTWQPDQSVLDGGEYEDAGADESRESRDLAGDTGAQELAPNHSTPGNFENLLLEETDQDEAEPAGFPAGSEPSLELDDGELEENSDFWGGQAKRRWRRAAVGIAVILLAVFAFRLLPSDTVSPENASSGSSQAGDSNVHESKLIPEDERTAPVDGQAESPQAPVEESKRAMLSPRATGIMNLLGSERTGVVEHLFADGSDVSLVTTPSGENKLTLALGLIGWQPVEVNVASFVNERKLEVHGAGLKLVFEVEDTKEAEGQVIRGTYKELNSGRVGEWRIW